MKRPEYITDEMVAFLEKLREQNKTNKFSIVKNLFVDEFNVSREEASTIVFNWLEFRTSWG